MDHLRRRIRAHEARHGRSLVHRRAFNRILRGGQWMRRAGDRALVGGDGEKRKGAPGDEERASTRHKGGECSIYKTLNIAARNGCTEVVRELDLQDKHQRTALMHAAFDGHTEVVHELVRAGAAIDMEDNDEHTALMRATTGDHTDVVNVLKGEMEKWATCRTNTFVVGQCGGTCYLAAPLILAIKTPKLYDDLRGYDKLHQYLVQLRGESLEKRCALDRATCRSMRRVTQFYEQFQNVDARFVNRREFAADGGHVPLTLQAFLTAAGCDWVWTERRTHRVSFQANPFGNIWWLEEFEMNIDAQHLGNKLQQVKSYATPDVVGGFLSFSKEGEHHSVAFTLCGTAPFRTLHVCNWGACSTFEHETEPLVRPNGNPLLDKQDHLTYIMLLHAPPTVQNGPVDLKQKFYELAQSSKPNGIACTCAIDNSQKMENTVSHFSIKYTWKDEGLRQTWERENLIKIQDHKRNRAPDHSWIP